MKSKLLIFFTLITLLYLVDKPLKYCGKSHFQKDILFDDFKILYRVGGCYPDNLLQSYGVVGYSTPISYDAMASCEEIKSGKDVNKKLHGYAYNSQRFYLLMETIKGNFYYIVRTKFKQPYWDDGKKHHEYIDYKEFLNSKYYKEFKELTWHSFDTCLSPQYDIFSKIRIFLEVVLVIWIFIFVLRIIKKVAIYVYRNVN